MEYLEAGTILYEMKKEITPFHVLFKSKADVQLGAALPPQRKYTHVWFLFTPRSSPPALVCMHNFSQLLTDGVRVGYKNFSKF